MRFLKLAKLIEEKNLDGVLITNILNIRYFSGFTGTTAMALITKEKRYLITDFRYISQAQEQVIPNGFEVVREDRAALEKIGELLKANNIKKLGIEDQSVSLFSFDSFKKIFGEIEYAALGDSFLKIRMIKSQEEIELIEKSVEIIDRAFEEVQKVIKPEVMTEKDVATELEYYIRKFGAEEGSFKFIVASRERSALPHGVASTKVIENEAFLKIDFGAFYKGYASDMTRTLYIGSEPSPKHLEIYNIVKEAQARAVAAARPGMTNKELDKIARDYITEKGYGENFGHGLGHGIGLQIHELPGISYKAEEIVLEPGMVITIEPGIYLEGFGGVRIEDDLVITSEGNKVLNKTTKELILIQ